MFELSRDSHQPLVDQICERVTQLVRHGQLPAGARLPSIRKLARQVGASPFTVVDAYDRLVARGVIEPRAGRGFFVTQRLLSAPLAAIEALPELGSDALELARQCLQQRGDVIAAGSGFLPESWLLEAGSAGVLTRLMRGGRTRPWLPRPAAGLGALREQIAAPLLGHRIPPLAGRFGFALVDAGVYGGLYAGSAVRLARVDALRHVVYVGRERQLSGPVLRVGF